MDAADDAKVRRDMMELELESRKLELMLRESRHSLDIIRSERRALERMKEKVDNKDIKVAFVGGVLVGATVIGAIWLITSD